MSFNGLHYCVFICVTNLEIRTKKKVLRVFKFQESEPKGCWTTYSEHAIFVCSKISRVLVLDLFAQKRRRATPEPESSTCFEPKDQNENLCQFGFWTACFGNRDLRRTPFAHTVRSLLSPGVVTPVRVSCCSIPENGNLIAKSSVSDVGK